MRDEGLIAWIGIAMTQKRFGYLILPLSLVLAATLVLTACDGGSDRPGPSPAVSSTSQDTSKVKSPSPNPTRSIPTPNAVYQPATLKSPAKNVPIPVKPPEADEFSEKGLKAFVLYWYKMYNYATETGRTDLVGLITQSSCEYCTKVLKNIHNRYLSKGWEVGGQLLVTKTQMTGLEFSKQKNGPFQIMIQFNQKDAKTLGADGIILESQKASVANGSIFNAGYRQNRWSVVDIGKIG